MVKMAALTIPMDETVSCIAFSPHQDSSDLLAVGTTSRIAIKSCRIKDDSEEVQSLLDVVDVEKIHSVLCNHPNHISWSPASSPPAAQYRFCASEQDSSDITMFASTRDSTTSQVLVGHKGSINDLCTHPSDHTLLASVGEDCACRVWDLEQGQVRSEFKLQSPGMSVKWHERDPVKLMVAERSGRIRIYDVSTDCPLQTLDCPTPPLICADWAPSNNLVVGGVAGGSWFLWDLSQSSQPLANKAIHKCPLSKFRWCVQSDQVFATLTASSQLRIHHLSHQRVPVSCDLQTATDLCWHAQIPLVGVASDREIKCWAVET